MENLSWQLLLESRASASWTLSPGMVCNYRSEGGGLGKRGHVQQTPLDTISRHHQQTPSPGSGCSVGALPPGHFLRVFLGLMDWQGCWEKQ